MGFANMRCENKPLNESFKKKIESVQYNAALIIAGAIKGTVVIKFIKN